MTFEQYIICSVIDVFKQNNTNSLNLEPSKGKKMEDYSDESG